MKCGLEKIGLGDLLRARALWCSFLVGILLSRFAFLSVADGVVPFECGLFGWEVVPWELLSPGLQVKKGAVESFLVSRSFIDLVFVEVGRKPFYFVDSFVGDVGDRRGIASKRFFCVGLSGTTHPFPRAPYSRARFGLGSNPHPFGLGCTTHPLFPC